MRPLFRLILSIFCLAIMTFTVIGAEPVGHTFTPSNGFVTDEQTAIKIAEAVWFPIYGKGIYKHRSFIARLKGGAWIVEGSLPKGMVGGTPLVEISKSDGRILRVTHGK